jgi:hypothetical protein
VSLGFLDGARGSHDMRWLDSERFGEFCRVLLRVTLQALDNRFEHRFSDASPADHACDLGSTILGFEFEALLASGDRPAAHEAIP